MRKTYTKEQGGLALPVMLIILLVMLISSIYLLKSSNSTTLTASNLAYDSAQSRAVDAGLHAGFKWLSQTAAGSNKALLNEDSPQNGYLATLDTTQTARSDAFWNGKKTVVHEGQSIEYVVHRLCLLTGAFDAGGNACVQTADANAGGAHIGVGDSLASDSPQFAETPKVHYVVTARLSGARGGNVVNQLVVLIGG
ncbi:hypothetical protein QPK31_18235 [Massilia sp. YIM B02769]|jgi:Tfp pilus assembly protein PilX|uniref:pilus assembly PilX family protein n=1 Tax=unclassified Massilia TaxID=2609279 RepID=UPI0025B6DBBC|nr:MULTISPECIES: hypothetical protein [unclassified Massilia]MDN4060149.1 hypothetical protein [Massilia sp. YIM B02769]